MDNGNVAHRLLRLVLPEDRAASIVGDLLEQLYGTFHQLRQSGIDEELFDVISGFEALVVTR